MVPPSLSLRAERSNLLQSCVEIATSPLRAPRNDMIEKASRSMTGMVLQIVDEILRCCIPQNNIGQAPLKGRAAK